MLAEMSTGGTAALPPAFHQPKEARVANPAGIFNLLIEQGASRILPVTWTDEDGNTPDLSSGYTAEAIISDKAGGTAELTLTNGSGIALAASGSITVTWTPTQTAALTARESWWELSITKTSSGRTDKILKGRCTVEAEAAP
jgi:hypothetical protein